MIKVKTILKESNIHKGGIGMFADEFIKKGDVVITPSTSRLDVELEKREFDKLPQQEKGVILHYGFKNKFNGKYHLNFDNARFINHSEDGNLALNEDSQRLYARRDIHVGDELAQDYSEFEELRDDLR